MALNNAKHIVSEINGIRCTIVEKNTSLERAAFLTDLLRFNNYEVLEMKEITEAENMESGYTIGVTDLVFNPVFAVYEKLLQTREGTPVTPAYWKQEGTSYDSRYWVRRKGARKTIDG